MPRPEPGTPFFEVLVASVRAASATLQEWQARRSIPVTAAGRSAATIRRKDGQNYVTEAKANKKVGVGGFDAPGAQWWTVPLPCLLVTTRASSRLGV